MLLVLLLTLLFPIDAQTLFDYVAEGIFSGCWSETGSLNALTFISLFPVNNAGGGLPIDTLLIPLPNDPTPDIVSQDPNSLLIQMGDIQHLSRNQLCNGLNAPPFPGTSSTPSLGQNTHIGFYGSTVVVTGRQEALPECTPPGVPGVICDPTKAQIFLTGIDIIVVENLISGYLTPPTDPRATFNVNNIPCVPIFYVYPLTRFSIEAVVIDRFGFLLDPNNVPTQGQVVVEGWYSQITGERLFYYFQTMVLSGPRLPNQFIAIEFNRCVQTKGELRMRGGVSTGTVAAVVDYGTVSVFDPLTNALLATVVPVAQNIAIPTGLWTVLVDIGYCPRSIRATWNPPNGVVPSGSPVSTTVSTFIAKA